MSRVHGPPRHLLITGASSGLGAGLARSYAGPGMRLALVGRNAERLHATAAACRAEGATVETALLDVAEPDPIAAFALAQDAVAPIDLVIANAGISAGPDAQGMPEGADLAARQIRTNLLGTVHTVEPVLPAMIARGTGHVAVVASVAGLRGQPYCPGYSASKAGIRAYGDGLRALLAPRGVAVSVVIPGFFDTPMTDRFVGDKPMMLSLDRAVRAARRGLDRRAARITFPRLLGLGLQATDVMPARLGDLILRQVPFHIRPAH